MALTRFTTRAAIMHRYLREKDPLVEAQVELNFYLSHVGYEEYLDADDELDVEEEGLEKEQVKEQEIEEAGYRTIGEEASKEKASGSGAPKVHIEGKMAGGTGGEAVVTGEEAEKVMGSDAPT